MLKVLDSVSMDFETSSKDLEALSERIGTLSVFTFETSGFPPLSSVPLRDSRLID